MYLLVHTLFIYEEYIYKPPLTTQNTMKNSLYNQAKLDAIISLFDGLTFDQVTTTSEWDELTCNEQMTIEDLIG